MRSRSRRRRSILVLAQRMSVCFRSCGGHSRRTASLFRSLPMPACSTGSRREDPPALAEMIYHKNRIDPGRGAGD
jgi:hypothetical protein